MGENITNQLELSSVEEAVSEETAVETASGVVLLSDGDEALEAVEETTVEHSIAFTPDAFMNSLPYMGKGMFGIFLVTALIVSCVVRLDKATAKRKK